MKYLTLTLASLLCAAPLYASPAPDTCLTYDCQQMQEIKQKISHNDATYAPALQALMKKADAALQHSPYSVTHKKLLPASGTTTTVLVPTGGQTRTRRIVSPTFATMAISTPPPKRTIRTARGWSVSPMISAP